MHQNKLKESVTVSVTCFEGNCKHLTYRLFQDLKCSQRDHRRRTKVRLFVLKCIHFQHFRKKGYSFRNKENQCIWDPIWDPTQLFKLGHHDFLKRLVREGFKEHRCVCRQSRLKRIVHLKMLKNEKQSETFCPVLAEKIKNHN